MATHSADDAWRPSADIHCAKERSESLRVIREFFAERGVLQVDTPALGTTTVTDPNIQSISASVLPGETMFLQTSPEYFMKRLLAAGYPDIYQVCKVFRAGESGRMHSPEFTMVEWYRRGFSLNEIMRETAELVAQTLGRAHLIGDIDYLDYTDAFEERVGVDPLSCDVESLQVALHADHQLRASLGDDRNTWLDLAMSTLLTPSFSKDRLTILHHYPASLAALAQRCPENHSIADRFEVFFAGMELANGFVELTDANEQRERFDRDRQTRAERGDTIPEVDEQLVAALQSGLPPCAGVAVGFERMLMIKTGSNDIRDVQSFTIEVPEIG